MTTSFQEIWNTRHFHYPFQSNKDVLKASQALYNTMLYYEDVNADRPLKDVFVKHAVVPLLPDPNVFSEQWPDQGKYETTRRILCRTDDKGQHFYDQRSALAAITSCVVFSEDIKVFDFVSGLYQGSYPSAMRDVLGHLWKYRVAVRGEDNPDNKPQPNEYRKMVRWLYLHLRPHHEQMMDFLNRQTNLISC